MTAPVVGLLQCDHLPVAEVAGDYDVLFRDLLTPHGVEVRAWSLIDGQVPASLGECDGWVIGGSRHSVNDDLPWVSTLLDLVREAAAAERPLVGVCFGHQAIARALGGTVERSAHGLQAGAVDYRWCDGSGGFRLIAMHEDQVITVPPGAEVLATADECDRAVFTVGERVLGVQPHPDFDAVVSRALVERRRGDLGDARADERLATLDQPLDRAEWGRRIVRFLTGQRVPVP